MNQLNRIIEGLTMFLKVIPVDELEHSVAAEHDVIYAGPNPDVFSEEQLKHLEDIGWRVEEEFDCFQFFT